MACVCLLTSQKTESVLFARMLCLSLREKGHTVCDYAVTNTASLAQSIAFASFDLLVLDADDIPPSRLPGVAQSLPTVAYTQVQKKESDAQNLSVLTRPFTMQSFFELVAKHLQQPIPEVLSLSVKEEADTDEKASFDPCVHPISEQEDGIYYGTQRLALSATERALLSYLLSRRGQVCTRAELLAHVWGDDGKIKTNLVDVYIRYLRHKLDLAFDIRAILSVRNQGYLLR